MSAQHTPGRLTLNTTYAEHELRGEGGELIAVSMPHRRVSDARRLVACWNACDGVPTDALEQIEGFGKAALPYHQLKAQNKALLAAITQVRDRFFPENQPERDRDLLWEPVNTAIAQATGQEGGAG